MMVKWQMLESWLDSLDDPRFTVYEVADAFGFNTWDATDLIQAYQDAQRRPRSKTRYVLKRQGRTRAAVWSVGQRTRDARLIGETLFEDFEVRVRDAYAPDMARLAMLNPRAASFARTKIDQVLKGVMEVLAGAVDGFHSSDDDE